MTTVAAAASEDRLTRWRFWDAIGPGFVFLAAMTGPGTVLSNAVAGANYGYGLIWAFALSLMFRLVWVETTARYVLVTGESLLQGYARVSKWLIWIVFGAALIVRHSTNLYTILLMGDAVHSLAPLPLAYSAAVWTVVFTLLGSAMMFWGGYPVLERGCKILMAILVAAIAAAAFYSHPQPLPILEGTFVPSVPTDQGVYSSILLITAMIGAQVGTLSNLSYAYFIREKGWRGATSIGRQRFDLVSGFGCRFLMGSLLQIAAAGTLFSQGIVPKNANDLTQIFRATLGDAGGIVFAVGLWAMCFSNLVGGTSGYGLIIRDISRRYIPRFAISDRRLQEPAKQDAIYRWTVAALGLSPLYIVFTQAESVALALTVRSLVVVLIPILGAALLVLANKKELMGEHRNSWKSNFVIGLMLVVSIYLVGRTIVDLL